MKKAPEVPEHLGWRDYFQMITTVLMAGLGSYILWQTIWVRWVFPSFIFGLALFLFGILRMRMIWLYFQERVKKHGT